MSRKYTRKIQELIKTRHKIFFYCLIVIIIFLIIDFIRGGITNSILSSDINKLSEIIQWFGILGPIFFILLVTIEVMVAPIPGFIFFVTGGVLFGWFWGAVLTLIGNLIGASLAFLLAKYLGRDYIKRKINSKKLTQFDKYTDRFGGYGIFLLRVNPFTSSDVFSYMAGFFKIPYKDFILGTFFGLLPLSFIQTYFGKTLIDSSPVFYWLFLIMSLLYFVGAFYVIYKHTNDSISD